VYVDPSIWYLFMANVAVSCMIVLHPQYKSSYFHKAGWPREWITTAKEILQTEWNRNYKPKAIPIKCTPVAVTYFHYVHVQRAYVLVGLGLVIA
jgi:hypothetical protein